MKFVHPYVLPTEHLQNQTSDLLLVLGVPFFTMRKHICILFKHPKETGLFCIFGSKRAEWDEHVHFDYPFKLNLTTEKRLEMSAG